MAQEKVLGVQLNLADVAAALLGDPTAEASFNATYLRRDGTVTMDGTLTLSASNNLVVGGTAALNGGLGANLNVNGYDIVGKPAGGSPSAGGDINITSSDAAGYANAGVVNLTGGNSPGKYQNAGNINLIGGVNTSATFGYCGSIVLTGGDHAGANGYGGHIRAYAGDGHYSGEVKMFAGASAGAAGGNVQIRAGNNTGTTAGTAGNFNLTAGYGIAVGGSTNGGTFTIKAGNANGSGLGGDVNVTAGNGNSANAGTLYLTGGTSTSATGGNVQITPGSGGGSVGFIGLMGANSTVAADVRFHENNNPASQYIALKAPDNTVTTSRTWTLPEDDPSTVAGQFLTTDASGVLSFASGELVNDTSPQLGGDLNLNGFSITVGTGSPVTNTITSTEISYLDGVSSNIQSQLSIKLENVVEDTTPQLGANLSVNGFDITAEPAATTTSAGNNVTLVATNGGSTSGAGGAIGITSGYSSSGNGGNINITAGYGYGGTSAGGSINLTAGYGQTSSGADGGAVILTAGDGGDTAGTTNGGNVEILAGAAGTSTQGTGGSILLRPGLGDETGPSGAVVIGTLANTNARAELRFLEDSANGTNYVGLIAPTVITNDALWTIPEAQNNSGDPLGIDLGEYTIAGSPLGGQIPAASSYPNCWAVVTDFGSPPARAIVRSDGTNWRYVADEGAIVA